LTTLLFPEDVGYDITYKAFMKSPLGQLYAAIPWNELAGFFESRRSKSPQGRKSRLSIKGGLGLMFLKHYTGLSDEKLVDALNGNWKMQLFCGIRVGIMDPIQDKDLPGRWRRFFGIHMDIEVLQDRMAEYWKADMEQTHVLMDDATCYESYIKYPTDVKLLFNCTEWIFARIEELCCFHKLKKPRQVYGYNKQQNRQTDYQRRKKKPYKLTRRRRRQLLYWLDCGIQILQSILNQGRDIHQKLKPKFYDKIKTIKTIYSQQEYMYNHQGESVKNRIVSLYKPYIRPIVRGKENKRVEFGAKVHISQVDQINFIEHFNFEAFHEGNRMWKSMYKHKKRFRKCHQYAADQLYATNKNRKYCTKNKIYTCFKKKGKPSKDEDQKKVLRRELGRARATILEGSFGSEKNHYLLRKVKARSKETEIAWIFFGVHTANAVKIGKRIQKKKDKEKHKGRLKRAA